MKENLFLEIDRFSLRYDYFLFFDTSDYLADQLFIQKEVRVWFGDEYKKPGSPFIGIICKVKKKDRTRFIEALDALENKMILCGYRDYESKVGSMLCKINSMKMIKPKKTIEGGYE